MLMAAAVVLCLAGCTSAPAPSLDPTATAPVAIPTSTPLPTPTVRPPDPTATVPVATATPSPSPTAPAPPPDPIATEPIATPTPSPSLTAPAPPPDSNCHGARRYPSDLFSITNRDHDAHTNSSNSVSQANSSSNPVSHVYSGRPVPLQRSPCPLFGNSRTAVGWSKKTRNWLLLSWSWAG